MKTYEQWREEQLRFVRTDLPRTIDGVEILADDVARNGSEIDSPAEQLAYAVDGLVAEIRERRAADKSKLRRTLGLSEVERKAIEWMCADIRATRYVPQGGYTECALAALDRILAVRR